MLRQSFVCCCAESAFVLNIKRCQVRSNVKTFVFCSVRQHRVTTSLNELSNSDGFAPVAIAAGGSQAAGVLHVPAYYAHATVSCTVDRSLVAVVISWLAKLANSDSSFHCTAGGSILYNACQGPAAHGPGQALVKLNVVPWKSYYVGRMCWVYSCTISCAIDHQVDSM